MANCSRCPNGALTLIRHGSEAMLNCGICQLTITGSLAGGFLIPHQDNMPILWLREELANEAPR